MDEAVKFRLAVCLLNYLWVVIGLAVRMSNSYGFVLLLWFGCWMLDVSRYGEVVVIVVPKVVSMVAGFSSATGEHNPQLS